MPNDDAMVVLRFASSPAVGSAVAVIATLTSMATVSKAVGTGDGAAVGAGTVGRLDGAGTGTCVGRGTGARDGMGLGTATFAGSQFPPRPVAPSQHVGSRV